ncbi:hypothetical protein C8J57DRAFT_1513579 [Mycena rebaudengoi]|nr:hypothetical protein C8J57DRAFT_1513579 [Mycena rebaudengoi]
MCRRVTGLSVTRRLSCFHRIARPTPSRPRPSPDASKPSLKHKLDGDDAEEQEHPHKLAARRTGFRLRPLQANNGVCLGVCVHVHVHVHDMPTYPDIPTQPLTAATMRSPSARVPSQNASAAIPVSPPFTARSHDAVRPHPPPVPCCGVFFLVFSRRHRRAPPKKSNNRPASPFPQFIIHTPHVRLYRDLDFLFTAFLTLLVVYLTFSPIALPASLDALLAILPNPSSSVSSSSSSGPSRFVDEPPAPCVRPPELAGRVVLAAPGEACERWLERAAVSVSVSMVVRLHLHFAVSTHYAHMLRSASSAPSSNPDVADAELAMSTPHIDAHDAHTHAHPPVPRTPLAQRSCVGLRTRRGVVRVDLSREGARLVSRATEVWVSATWPSGANTRHLRFRSCGLFNMEVLDLNLYCGRGGRST